VNKQQLAAKIWESANQMRSKIEANEYKDYILGFIFYKYLSDKQRSFAKTEDFTDADICALSEEDTETVEHIKTNIGYFMAYEHLFSTWIERGKDFDVSNVRAGKLKASYSTSSVRICRTKEINISFNSLCSSCFSLNTVSAVKFDIANT
jgi:type I restriction-modification system DNA methylase subunit